MWSPTTAERQHLASRCRTCCLRRCLPARPLRTSSFRGSIAHPTGSLCTLRSRRHRRPRNTHYRAPATTYPGRTCTGWTAPASWRTSNLDRDCFVAALLARNYWLRVWPGPQAAAGQRLDLHLIAELVELRDEAVGFDLVRTAVEIVGAEVLMRGTAQDHV